MGAGAAGGVEEDESTVSFNLTAKSLKDNELNAIKLEEEKECKTGKTDNLTSQQKQTGTSWLTNLSLSKSSQMSKLSPKPNPTKKQRAKWSNQAKALPLFTPPVITSVPRLTSHEQLLNFLAQDKIRVLRPQAKVVAILHSTKKHQTHKGLMFRKRIGKKENNVWKQVIQPTEDGSLPKLFRLVDSSIKETKPREVHFKIAYWRDKWPYARLVEDDDIDKWLDL